MRSQIVTAYQNKRNVLVTPFTFTEQGVAMLSEILNSAVAIQVNSAIVRLFIMIKKYAWEHKEFNAELLEIETKYDKKFSNFYKALNYLIKKR